ncbi:MAG: AbrB/MazE/SpoVT family DNA-binding domain-containing protein [Planctomycetota bacterium]
MKETAKTDTVRFTTKGQVVIPWRLRKEFGIVKGTRALVFPEEDHLILKPITAVHIRRLRGSLKGKSLLTALLEERKREREL